MNIFDRCYEIYEKNGFTAVLDHVDEQKRWKNPEYMDVHDEFCVACDIDTPCLGGFCIVCGQSVK